MTTDLGDALSSLPLPRKKFHFEIEFPEGFEFGSCQMIWDGRWAIALHHEDEKGLRVWGIGYDKDVDEATKKAVERVLSHLHSQRDYTGFLAKDHDLRMPKNMVAPTREGLLKATDAIDTSKLTLTI